MSDTKLIAEQTVELVRLRLVVERLQAKADLCRATLVRVRPHVEAVALSRGTGHVQADCDLRAVDELLA
jgi:ABC-type uncharacterized transport system fused permease/ATPase subunit